MKPYVLGLHYINQLHFYATVILVLMLPSAASIAELLISSVSPWHLHNTSSFLPCSTRFTSLVKLRSLPCACGLIQYQITHKPLPHPYTYLPSSPNVCLVCQLGKWQLVVSHIVQPGWPPSHCLLAAGWSRRTGVYWALLPFRQEKYCGLSPLLRYCFSLNMWEIGKASAAYM